MKPNIANAQAYGLAYDHLNDALWGGKLPPAMLIAPLDSHRPGMT